MARTRTHVALIAAVVAAAGAALLAGCGGDNAESARGTAAPSATRSVADASATPVTAAAAPTITAMPEPSVVAPAPSVTSVAAPPTEAPQPTATPPAPAASGVTVTIAAQNARFVPVAASAPLGARVTVVFNNDDASVSHDLVLFGPDRTRVGATSIFYGPGTEQFSFDAVAAGRYGYACTVHRTMSGALTVE